MQSLKRVKKAFSVDGLALLGNIHYKQFVTHLRLLYEQQTNKKATSNEMALVLGNDTKHWQYRCSAGLHDIRLELYEDLHRTYLVDLNP